MDFSGDTGSGGEWQIGIRAHDLGRASPGEMAARVRDAGFSCVQLAVNKAIAGPERTAADLTKEFAAEVRAGFAQRGVSIAVLGCYINPLQPDPELHRANLAWFDRHLELAADFGCGIVALESGSLNGDYSPHPDNSGEEALRRSIERLRGLVATAERAGSCVGIEGVAVHALSTPERLRCAFDAIASPHLVSVFDPVNLLTAQNWKEQRAVIDRSLELLGERIRAVHLKDFVVEDGVLRPALLGRGAVDWAYLFQRLRTLPRRPVLLLEEVPPEHARAALAHVRRFAAPGATV